MFFRPEDIEFNSNGHGQPAIIETKIFQGLLTRLYLRIDEADQAINRYADLLSRQAAHLDVGSTVRISIDSAYAKVFPAEGVAASGRVWRRGGFKTRPDAGLTPRETVL